LNWHHPTNSLIIAFLKHHKESTMFGLGAPEIVIVLLLALVLFGAQRLPELGKGLGQGIREFKKSTRELREDLDLGLNDEPAQSTSRQAPRQAKRMEVKDALASEPMITEPMRSEQFAEPTA
jgi:sec-independent protein translocase protein TatA